jgi:hypothetical protein
LSSPAATRIARSLSLGDKEALQHVGASLLENTACSPGLVVQAWLVQQVEHRAEGTGLGVRRAKDHTGDAGMQHRSGTHGAGFQGHVELAAIESVIAQRQCSRAHGIDLGMRRRVMTGDRRVSPHPHNASILDHHGADRHFTISQSKLRLFQRQRHECLI